MAQLSARLEHARAGDLQVAVVRIGLRDQTLEVLLPAGHLVDAGNNPGHARHNGGRNRSMRPRLPTRKRSRFIDVLFAHAGRDGYRDRLRVHDLNLISLANILHLLGVLHDHIHRVVRSL